MFMVYHNKREALIRLTRPNVNKDCEYFKMAKPPSPDPDFILRGSGEPITSLLFYQRKAAGDEVQELISGNMDGSVHVWNLKTHRPCHKLHAHPGHTVLSLHQLGPEVLCTQGRDGLIHIWKGTEADWHRSASFSHEACGFCPCAPVQVAGKSCLVVPSASQSQLQLIDLQNSHTVMTLTPKSGEKAYGMCMDIKPVRSTEDLVNLVCGYEDGSIALWDLRTGNETSRHKFHTDSVMCLDYSLEGNRGISGSVGNTIHTWNIKELGTVVPSGTINITNNGLNSVCIRSDAKIFATGGWDSRIRIFGVKKCKPLAVLSFHTQSVQTVAFDPVTNSLAAGSKDSLITLWSIYK